jgi:hypothetical protein
MFWGKKYASASLFLRSTRFLTEMSTGNIKKKNVSEE